ncbi:MAG TPA: hypothetical protein VMS11_13210 [Solirubrobacterales bacterium]|nr:hypothetical protein [Solirubrobacterales bacterium]
MAMLALSFGSAAASAATQHWYGIYEGPRLPTGSPTAITGEQNTATTMAFSIAGAEVEIACNSMKASGTIENPAGGVNGKLREASLTYGECQTVKPAGGVCTVPSTITTNALRGEATLGGKAGIRLEPENGTAFTTFTIGGSSCPSLYKGSKTLTGGPTAEFIGYENQYETGAFSPSTLKYAGQTVTLLSKFELNSNAGLPVAIGVDTDPAGERWYVGGEKSKPTSAKFAAGSAVSYVSRPGSTGLAITATIAGVKFNMACSGSGSGFEGSVENPAGGGAGTATGTMTLAGCYVSEPSGGVCSVESPVVSTPLSGLAGEAAGAPAVTFSPIGKSTIATFVVSGGSCPTALKGSKSLTGSGLTGAFSETGKLLFSSSLNAGLKFAGQTATVSAQTTPEAGVERLLLAP